MDDKTKQNGSKKTTEDMDVTKRIRVTAANGKSGAAESTGKRQIKPPAKPQGQQKKDSPSQKTMAVPTIQRSTNKKPWVESSEINEPQQKKTDSGDKPTEQTTVIQTDLKLPPGGRKEDTPTSEHTVVFQDNLDASGGDDGPMIAGQQHNKITSWFKPREKKPNFVISIILTVFKLLLVVVFVFIAVGAGSVIGVANAYLETTPELDTQKIEDQNLTSYIYDQQGNLLTTYTGNENRDKASIDEIPVDLQNAVIAVEDIRFYEHTGVDFRRLAGAFAANLSSSRIQGGSTITQQLVKNKLLTNERSYKRKLQEAFLATELETKYTKLEILEAYLNTIPLGGKVYGVKTAAKDYFGKELNELTLKEMVCIAAITQSTTKFNPRRATYTKPEDLPYLIDRMNIITQRMWWNDMITDEQYNETFIPAEEYLAPNSRTGDEGEEKELYLAPGFLEKWKDEMQILQESPANEIYQYPHFVEYVIYDVQTFMLKQDGLEDTEENRRIVDRKMRAGGYRIYATIDAKMQETVQNTLSEWENYPGFENSSDNVVTKMDLNGNPQEIIQPQAAAVVIDNETGYLRAIVGSRDTPDQLRTFNRAYEGQMEIGSSIKPIAVYGPAFDMGYSLASHVANVDVPIIGWTDDVSEENPGHPRLTGEPGPMSMHNAIVNSINVAAARTVTELVTVDVSAKHLQEKLGVNPDHILATPSGLSMGNSPITPIEMVGAYSTIARGGEYLQPMSFSLVQDNNGNDVINVEKERAKHQGFKSTTAWMLNTALQDAVDHGTGTNAKISGFTTAGKTGTVSYMRGAYFAGYTYKYTSALWVGHDDFKSFKSNSDTGGSIAAPLWKSYMTKIHEGLQDREIFPGTPESYGMVKGAVCKYSNMKLSSSCSRGEEDWMPATDIPMEECTWCKGEGGYSYCTETYLKPTEYCPRGWRSGHNFPETSPYFQSIGNGAGGGPSSYCNVHTADWYASTQVPDEQDVPSEMVLE